MPTSDDRVSWVCSFPGCGKGQMADTAADAAEEKASHEQFCDKNPNNK